MEEEDVGVAELVMAVRSSKVQIEADSVKGLVQSSSIQSSEGSGPPLTGFHPRVRTVTW